MKKIWCVIPVYNNGMTVHSVVRQCLRELPDLSLIHISEPTRPY